MATRHVISATLAGLVACFSQLAFAAPLTVTLTLPSDAREPAALGAKLSAWNKSEQVSGVYRLDANEQNPEFKTLVVLEFEDESAYGKWKKDEAAGLSPLVLSDARVLKRGSSRMHDPSSSAFRVNVYTPKVPDDEFQVFIDGYMVPLLEAQCEAGIMWNYSMYMVTAPSGQKKTLWILEYKDSGAYDDRGPVKTAIKKDLMARSAVFTKYRTLHPSLRDINATFTSRISPIR